MVEAEVVGNRRRGHVVASLHYLVCLVEIGVALVLAKMEYGDDHLHVLVAIGCVQVVLAILAIAFNPPGSVSRVVATLLVAAGAAAVLVSWFLADFRMHVTG
jgi:hypothetical protein